MSGGSATLASRRGIKNATQVGDISAIDPLGHQLLDIFAVECKNYRDLGISTSFFNQHGKLLDFWTEHLTKSKEAGKGAILIAQQSRMRPFMLVSIGNLNMKKLNKPSSSIAVLALLGRPSLFELSWDGKPVVHDFERATQW